VRRCGNTIIDDGAIAIADNSISWLGKAAGLLPAAREILHARNTIAMPGLIDLPRAHRAAISAR